MILFNLKDTIQQVLNDTIQECLQILFSLKDTIQAVLNAMNANMNAKNKQINEC